MQEISKILSERDKIILLFGVKDKIYVFGSSSDPYINIGNIVKEICENLGGKGGGTSTLAKGVGIKKEILNDVMKSLRDKFQ